MTTYEYQLAGAKASKSCPAIADLEQYGWERTGADPRYRSEWMRREIPDASEADAPLFDEVHCMPPHPSTGEHMKESTATLAGPLNVPEAAKPSKAKPAKAPKAKAAGRGGDGAMSETALRPSLAGMRKNCLEPHPARRVTISRKTFIALLDIAEAAQAMFETAGHDASPFDFEFEGDRIEAVENALAKVRA